MTLFERLWRILRGFASNLRDQRGARRHPLPPGFRPSVLLRRTATGPGGQIISGSLHDLSNTGAAVRLPANVCLARGDRVTLRIPLEEEALEIPGTVAHCTVLPEHAVCGIFFQFSEVATQQAYLGLSAAVAVGRSLAAVVPNRPSRAGASQYLEQYEGNEGTRLTVWRDDSSRAIDRFEMTLADHVYQGGTKKPGLEIRKRNESGPVVPGAGETKLALRHYRWMVQNLSGAVPEDVRDLLPRLAEPHTAPGVDRTAASARNS